jgi:zinc and cadmium transporter
MIAVVYSLIAVIVISLVSLIGILFLNIKTEKLKRIIIYLVSFSAGALFADAFLHLIPEASENFSPEISAFVILFGIFIFLFLEKIILWNHCHIPITKNHIHSFVYMNLIGDLLHNFLDGLIIISSFMISTKLGIATSLAVFFHEIPQEIGDFGILVHGGIKPKKAILINLLIAMSAVLGAFFGFFLFSFIFKFESIILLIAAGGFIYIAGSDLIPELHKQNNWKNSLIQIFFFITGILIIASLLFL